ARRGAYPLVRLGFTSLWPNDGVFAAEAPEEIAAALAPADRLTIDQMDARITIDAPENTREGADLPPERRAWASKASRPFYERSSDDSFPWVGCQFPTPALAQDAGMTTAAFESFLYGAVLRDWDEETRRMEPWAARVTAAKTVRIVGHETDLTLGGDGRPA